MLHTVQKRRKKNMCVGREKNALVGCSLWKECREKEEGICPSDNVFKMTLIVNRII